MLVQDINTNSQLIDIAKLARILLKNNKIIKS